MGREFRDKGANVQLGPGVCLARVPVNGRNFEYLSGEGKDYTLVYILICMLLGLKTLFWDTSWSSQ